MFNIYIYTYDWRHRRWRCIKVSYQDRKISQHFSCHQNLFSLIFIYYHTIMQSQAISTVHLCVLMTSQIFWSLGPKCRGEELFDLLIPYWFLGYIHHLLNCLFFLLNWRGKTQIHWKNWSHAVFSSTLSQKSSTFFMLFYFGEMYVV